jgi:hypothetical protein
MGSPPVLRQRTQRAFGGMPLLFVWALAGSAVACGGDSEGGGQTDATLDSDAATDGGTLPDGAADPDADTSVQPDADATLDPDGAETGEPDTDELGDADDADVQRDADGQGGGDADADAAFDGEDGTDADDAADAGDERIFVPGTLPLPNYIGCDENSDCPNGTGNCITALTLNRADAAGRLRIPMGEVFEGLERSGVCSLDCAAGAAPCATLALTIDPSPWSCQLVYADDSAYPIDGLGARPAFPFADEIDPSEMTAGPAFGALCRPPFERSADYAPDFCVECSSALNCHPGSACVVVSPWASEPADAGTCLSPCTVGAGCPSGFECRQPDAARDGLVAGEDTQEYCFPTLGSCSPCADADGDGFGVGGCGDTGGSSAVDCDDRDPLAWWEGPTSVHPFPDVCGADEDANCNGIADRTEQVGTVAFGAFHCGECGDVCDRSAPQASTFSCVRLTTGIEGTCRPVCDAPTQFFDCDGLPDNGCEAEVTDIAQLFVPDCDGDGVGRANAAPQFDCAGAGALTIFTDVDGDDATDDRRDCEVVQAVAVEGSGFGADCNDGDAAVSPSGLEICDGIDNNCDGAIDPYELFQLGDSCVPSDAAVVGACRAGAVRVCDDAGGVACQPSAPSAEVCDGIDNDCDGLVDNLGSPTVENRLGEACRASDDPGPCGAGALVCQGGGLVCSPALLPERDPAGDGVDADCDGVDADSERAIFVAVGGATVQGSGPVLGSPLNPVGTLARAYELIRVREASPVPVEQLILASGSYTLPHGITLPGTGFTISGGWTRDVARNVWTPATTGRSTVEISSVCRCEPAIDSTGTCVQAACEPADGYVAAIGVQDPAGVRLANLDLVVAAQPAARGPVVGLACRAVAAGTTATGTCAGLSLEQVSLEMANAQAGAPHAAPAAAENGRQSDNTLLGNRCGPDGCSFGGLAGGGSSCGAQGGDGAGFYYNRVVRCDPPFGDAVQYNPVAPATAGSPAPLGGDGGVSGSFTATCQPIASGSMGGRGQTRASAGSGGVAGTGASASRPLQPASGTAGTPGLPGGGGGGGGGLPLLSGPPTYGGGGSSGGCGGTGGAPGLAGGTVIGLLIDDPSTSPVFSSVTIRVGSGGAGGPGQSGGLGGLGSGPASVPFMLGGASGHGAGGGGGGGGAGGSSIGIARWPAVPVLITPSVGSPGAGGAGGAAGAGGTGGIFMTTDPASVVFETAAAGQPGTRGADGVTASFCSLAPGTPPAGEVACR